MDLKTRTYIEDSINENLTLYISFDEENPPNFLEKNGASFSLNQAMKNEFKNINSHSPGQSLRTILEPKFNTKIHLIAYFIGQQDN